MSAGTATADRRPDRVTAGGLLAAGLCAIVLSASALYDLGRCAGWDRWMAALLPGVVSVYAICTVRIYLAGHTRSARVRTAAKRQAAVAIAAELAGNGLAHLLASGAVSLGSWRWALVLAVALVPPAAVGGLVHLVALRARDAAFGAAEAAASGGSRTAGPQEPGTAAVPPAGTTRGTATGTTGGTTGTAGTTRGTSRGTSAGTGVATGQNQEPQPGTTVGTAAPRPVPADGNPARNQRNHARNHAENRAVGQRNRTENQPRNQPRNQGNHAGAGSRDVLTFDPAERAEAVAVYRASVAVGEPMTQRALAARFDRSTKWARARIAEADTDPGSDVGDAEPASGNPGAAGPRARTAGEVAGDARDAAEAIAAYRASVTDGRPLSPDVLATCYQRSRGWAAEIIAGADGEPQPVGADRADPVKPVSAQVVRLNASGE